MDRRLIGYYERELQYMRDIGGEFARDFPKIAGHLGRIGPVPAAVTRTRAPLRFAIARNCGVFRSHFVAGADIKGSTPSSG